MYVPISPAGIGCSSHAARSLDLMPDQLDVEGMLQRFRDRAHAVRERPLPPVAGPERQRFVEQAQLDFQDFAMLGDATWSFDDGVLTLRVDLRPEAERD